MKKIKISFIIILLYNVSIFAIPFQINYRGKLFEGGNPVNGNKNIEFRIYGVPTGGIHLWSSGVQVINVNNGYYNYTLGTNESNPIPPAIFTNNFLYLEVLIGGSPLTPRERLVSTPYAFNANMVSGSNIFPANGKVGIGMISPSYPLDVNGTVRATSFIGDGSGLFGIPGLWSVNGSSLYYNGGNVGVGVMAPQRRLEVNGGADQYPILVNNPSSTWAGIEFKNQLSTGGAEGIWTSVDNLIFSAQGTTKMIITSNGNVGIGTVNPGQKLSVLYSGNGAITGPTSGVWASSIVNQEDAIAYNGLSVQNRWANTNSIIFEAAMGWNGSIAGYYPVFTIDGLGQAIFKPQRTEAMRIAANGNVGIGTTTPEVKLDIVTSSGAPAIRTSDGLGNVMMFMPYLGSGSWNPLSVAGDKGLIYYGPGGMDTGSFVLAPWSSTAKGIRIATNGNVGIGTASPNYPLQVGNYTYLDNDLADEFAVLGAKTAGGGMERLFLDANWIRFGTTFANPDMELLNGNLGIGTVTPKTKLHVAKDNQSWSLEPFGDWQGNGTLFLSGSANKDKRLALGYDTVSDVAVIQSIEAGIAAKNLYLNPNGGDVIFAASGFGNVGIGTTTPRDKLDVNGVIVAGNQSPSIVFAGDIDGAKWMAKLGGYYLTFLNDSVGGASLGTGNVIWGGRTYIPRIAFMNDGNIRMSSDHVGIINNSGNHVFKTGWDGKMGDYSAIFSGYGWDTGYEPLSVVAGNSGIFFTRGNPSTHLPHDYTMMKIDPSGNVGIGTNNPVDKVHVCGGGTGINVFSRIQNIGDSAAILDLRANQGRSWLLQSTGPGNSQGAGKFVIMDNTALVDRFVIDTSGRVGINIVNPSYTLDVNGDLRITGTPYRNGGDIAWQVPSDIRLKNIIRDYQYGLSEIMKLNPVNYTYKQNTKFEFDTKHEYTGLVAQEVEKVIPEAVSEGKEGYLTLNTTPIFWAMLNSIKELKKENDELKAKNDELEKRLYVIEKKLGIR